MSRQNDALIEQAVKAVRKAGALLTDQSAVRNIWAKSETDFVTNVDVTVQETLKAQLASRHVVDKKVKQERMK